MVYVSKGFSIVTLLNQQMSSLWWLQLNRNNHWPQVSSIQFMKCPWLEMTHDGSFYTLRKEGLQFFFLKKVYSYITELNISGLNNLDFFIGGVQSEQSNAVKHIIGQPFEENLSPRRHKNSPIWSHCTYTKMNQRPT